MNVLRTIAASAALAVAGLVGRAVPALAATQVSCTKSDGTAFSVDTPVNILAKVGFDFVKLDDKLTCSLGWFANVYVSLLNIFLLVAIALFAFVAVNTVVHYVKKGTEGNDGDTYAGGRHADHTVAALRGAIVDVFVAGALTLLAFLVITQGANLLLLAATGSEGLFAVDQKIGDYYGFFKPIVLLVMDQGAMLIVLAGGLVIAYKVAAVAMAIGRERGDGNGGKLIAGAVKHIGALALLFIVGFLVLRLGPAVLASAIGTTKDLVTTIK